MCWLSGPTVHIKSCDNCRGKHSWWKAISQIILATIRECGGVKWRFHMQMRRWEGATPPNGSLTLVLPAFGLLCMGRRWHKETASASWGMRKERWIKSTINHVETKTAFIFKGKKVQMFYISAATTGMYLK